MSRRRKVLLAIATVVVVAGAFGLYWFQPWKLFIDHRVDEALPPAATEPVAVANATVTPSTPPATSPSASPSASPPASSTASSTASPGTTTSSTPRAEPRAQLLSRGSLITHEHDTEGLVSVIRDVDGKLVLTLADLDTSDGPDVHVWLSDQPVKKGDWYNFGKGKHVDLGGLKGNLGNQVYKIPTGTDLARYRSVSIWCERFDVSFGAATLTPIG